MISSISLMQEPVFQSTRIVAEWEPIELVHNEIRLMNDFFAKRGINALIDYESRLGLFYEHLLPMQDHYIGEEIIYAGHLDRIAKHQVFPFKGKLFDTNGNLVETAPLDFDTGAMLVMTKEGALFLDHKKRGEVHHSTLLSADPVAYACMVEVRGGVIVKEKPWSGHYTPTKEHQEQFHDRLQRNFVKELEDHIKVVFVKGSGPRYEHVCVISREPLTDPVKLPCGHVFNKYPFIKWHKTRPVCPLDNKPVSLSDVKLNIDIFKPTYNSYGNNLEEIKNYNNQLDKTIVHLKLDDRPECFHSISRISKTPGVYLLLNSKTTFKKIWAIAKVVGLYNSSRDSEGITAGKMPFFLTGESTFYHPNSSISVIDSSKEGISGIPVIHLSSILFDEEMIHQYFAKRI